MQNIYIHVYICFAFVGLDNKLYQMHGTYIKTGHPSFWPPVSVSLAIIPTTPPRVVATV